MMLGIFIAIALACTALFLNYRSSRKSTTMQKTAVIAGLASDYDLVTYLDDDKKTATNYLVSENFRNIYSHIDPALPSNKRLDELFKAIIHPDDFSQFLDDVERKKSMEILSTHPTYTVRFRAQFGKEIQYYQVKIARDQKKQTDSSSAFETSTPKPAEMKKPRNCGRTSKPPCKSPTRIP